ncbi:ScbR family autoregulator-binding transcription factor [Streptomyces cellostaticus]|uniref:ScbR family autoregulator-binding transcription factor n=1 Tax=Streptomyces cellostaticus TaxID=67285 RepID=UPI0008365A1B|nr:ScbR family autoregulator-binding transcription factor [Streptomyces cellostaticus]GHI10390.1 TetR family transcriptional regulator [Streptomyces cellostaticus]
MAMQERAVRTRRSLIHAAAAVFTEEGYVPSSLATISKRAGVSNGALHFHFENKKALARAVEDQAADAVRRLVQPVHGGRASALQTLVDATYGLVGSLLDDIVVRAGFELSSQRALGPEARMLRIWHEWVEQTLHRAKAEGQLAPGVSSDDAAAAIVAVTVGLEVLAGVDPQWLAERRIAGFWELLLPGIATEPVCARPEAHERRRTETGEA